MNTIYYLPNAFNLAPDHLSKSLMNKLTVQHCKDEHINQKIKASSEAHAQTIALEFNDLHQRLNYLNILQDQIRTIVKNNLIDQNQFAKSSSCDKTYNSITKT